MMSKVKLIGLIVSGISSVWTLVAFIFNLNWGNTIDTIYWFFVIGGIIGGIICGSLAMWWSIVRGLFSSLFGGVTGFTILYFPWIILKVLLALSVTGILFALGVIGFPVVFALIGYFRS